MTTKIPLQENLITDKTFQFAVQIFKFSQLFQGQKQHILANQLQDSGTTIGANVIEVQNDEIKADFTPKFKVLAKKADGTEYWLLLSRRLSIILKSGT